MRWAGQHKGHSEGGKKTLILESIANHRKYLWWTNFGDAGSLNDLNVLDKSSIVGAMLSGDLDMKTEPFIMNGNSRDWAYFLADGIYPDWGVFLKTFSNATDPKKKFFAQKQEAVRKDIECAFGIVVSRFHVLKRPLRGWYVNDLQAIVHCCTILHNMIVVERFGGESEEEAVSNEIPTFPLFGKSQVTMQESVSDGVDLFSAQVAAFDVSMQSQWEHFKLKDDAVEHLNNTFHGNN